MKYYESGVKKYQETGDYNEVLKGLENEIKSWNGLWLADDGMLTVDWLLEQEPSEYNNPYINYESEIERAMEEIEVIANCGFESEALKAAKKLYRFSEAYLQR